MLAITLHSSVFHLYMCSIYRLTISEVLPPLISSSHGILLFGKLQDEITTSRGQVEPPGMHLIYLPYSDDIRHIEEASRIIKPCQVP